MARLRVAGCVLAEEEAQLLAAGARTPAELAGVHQPISEQGRLLASVVRGHMAYYAVPGNTQAVAAFRRQATRHWLKALRHRSQKGRSLTWKRMAGSDSGGYRQCA